MAETKVQNPAAENDEDAALFEKRESVMLTPENAVFSRSEGGLISLDLTGPGGESEHFERVVVLRSFPITDPDEYIAVREPETRKSHRILSVKDKLGYYYWDAETSAGQVSFVVNNISSNIRILEDERIFIFDIDGNCFQISDVTKLDRASYRKIEIYL